MPTNLNLNLPKEGIDFLDKLYFKAAYDWFKKKLPMSEKEYSQLETQAKQRAFYVSGIMKADILNSVFDCLSKAAANKMTLKDFAKAVGKRLDDEWGESVSNPDWRIETIYRTNVQTAFQAGRHSQHSRPITKKLRPYWKFYAKADNRITECCAALNGKILPADSPFWNTHYPPLHYNCRSKVVALRKNQITPNMLTDEKDLPKNNVQKGFGNAPTIDQEPDLSKYPKAIAEKIRKAIPKQDKPGQ